MTTVNLIQRATAREVELRKQYDSSSLLLKTAHCVASLFRQVHYWLAVFYHRCFDPTLQPFFKNEIEYKEDSRGLVVLIHGLRNHPAAWYSQLSLLQNCEKIDVYAPIVHKRGMCSLDEAVEPIYAQVLEYAQKNPKKPLCLLGVSNGSRIATSIEVKLREVAPSTPVFVSTIAGVHFGSSRMNLLNNTLKIAHRFYPEVLCDELSEGSKKATDLLGKLSAPLPNGCTERKYDFFATTEDLSVPNLSSSLPELNHGEKYTVFHGHSHDSIVPAVAQQQIRSCVQWIKNLSQ